MGSQKRLVIVISYPYFLGQINGKDLINTGQATVAGVCP